MLQIEERTWMELTPDYPRQPFTLRANTRNMRAATRLSVVAAELAESSDDAFTTQGSARPVLQSLSTVTHAP